MANFTFSLSLSTTPYHGKCTDWGHVCYKRMTLDIATLATYLSQGYCVTHTFRTGEEVFTTKQKTIANFESTNAVFIDVDDSLITASTFYETVTEKPTLLYTTPSNVTGVINRYRLVYLFNEPIKSNNVYKSAVLHIQERIKEQFDWFEIDSTSVNASQQMGGNDSKECIILSNDNIYSFSSFQIDEKTAPCIPSAYKKREENDIQNRNADDRDLLNITNFEFMTDFWNITADSAFGFIAKYGTAYPLIDATQVDKDIPYIPLNNDYVEITRRTYVVEDEYGNRHALGVKIKAGNRERILFTNALLRLKIQNTLPFEGLLFAMVYERQYWIDNTDRSITNRILYKVAKGAFLHRDKYKPQPTAGQKRKRAKNKSGYKVNRAYCEAHNVSVRSMANELRANRSDAILLEHYDFSKTVAENSRDLKSAGIQPNSERRLYQFKKKYNAKNQ